MQVHAPAKMLHNLSHKCVDNAESDCGSAQATGSSDQQVPGLTYTYGKHSFLHRKMATHMGQRARAVPQLPLAQGAATQGAAPCMPSLHHTMATGVGERATQAVPQGAVPQGSLAQEAVLQGAVPCVPSLHHTMATVGERAT